MSGKAECRVDFCTKKTAAEGLLCEEHWSMTYGTQKAEYNRICRVIIEEVLYTLGKEYS